MGMSAIDGVARKADSSQRGGLQFCFISMSLGTKAHWQQHKMLLVSFFLVHVWEWGKGHTVHAVPRHGRTCRYLPI